MAKRIVRKRTTDTLTRLHKEDNHLIGPAG